MKEDERMHLLTERKQVSLCIFQNHMSRFKIYMYKIFEKRFSPLK